MAFLLPSDAASGHSAHLVPSNMHNYSKILGFLQISDHSQLQSQLAMNMGYGAADIITGNDKETLKVEDA